MQQLKKTPLTIFSGFLGSGKTTVISHLIDKLQARGEQVVYIKNEIGDTDLDAKVMQGKHIQTAELLNGCICCTLVGPFHAAITELIERYQPDRILVEASGAADPAALALMASSHPQLYRDGLISIIDVVNFEGYKDLSTTAQNQTQFTDLIVFNKVELTDLARKQAVVGYIRELNGRSPIIEAPNGMLRPEVVFGISSKEVEKLLTDYRIAPLSEHTKDSHPHEHIAEDGIEACTITITKPLDQKRFLTWLAQLPKQVFRVKGVFETTEGDKKIINKVGDRVDSEDAPKHLMSTQNLIVCIGYKVNALEAELTEKLQALSQA